ncbi:MAG TPA: 1-(5-phosphoribosyl)-5-[(5-phosphoribosylamino)methylideneamino] imidazole-4-carboxamide isomerase [Longimicrobiales bacterium]|nr:1-(5-phosphoribosyl)-5-[(5-phosphoribosylamino)methylideneamino] imidazole-4-carboxamide isomerase [Longimicrobiales bacterium]
MIAYAALDLRGGRVVQLVGGRPEDERVSLPDPAAVARQWQDAGFAALHVVDLDGALGTGINDTAVDSILAASHVPVQVGGGIRTTQRAAALLERGAARVVVGTRAVEDPDWLEELAGRWPGRVVVAADVRDEIVVVRGWTAEASLNAVDLLHRLQGLPLAGVLVTDVGREGRMLGADVELFRRLAAATTHPLQASGGVADASDLAALARTGAAGVVLGMALYTGALDAHAIAREYSA